MKLELAPDPRNTRVQTRDGCKARILAYHPEQNYSLIGEMLRNGTWRASAWTKNGKYYAGIYGDDPCDLIPAPPEMDEVPVERIAVYVDGEFHGTYTDKASAEPSLLGLGGTVEYVPLRGTRKVPKQEPQPVVLEGKVSESSVNETKIVINLHSLGDSKFVGRKCTLTIQ